MRKVIIAGLVGAVILIAITGIFVIKKGTRDKKIENLLKEAQINFLKNDLLKAKEFYKEAILNLKNAEKLKEIQKKLEEINIKILFSPMLDECSIKYVVKSNDALVKIAKKFNTTVNLIKRANNLKSDVIRPGQELKVNTCKFSLVVDKSQNLLFLKRKGELIKTYLVSTGKNNSTPTGKFKIVNKLINPTWFKTGAVIPADSPENILGSRWMGLDIKGYGIHGTNKPDKLGRQITMGCIRMNNKDVEELFDIIPLGTEVTIVD